MLFQGACTAPCRGRAIEIGGTGTTADIAAVLSLAGLWLIRNLLKLTATPSHHLDEILGGRQKNVRTWSVNERGKEVNRRAHVASNLQRVRNNNSVAPEDMRVDKGERHFDA